MTKWEYKFLDKFEWRALVQTRLGWKPSTMFFMFPWGQRARRARAKWNRTAESVLNDMGEEGWELATEVPIVQIMLGSDGTNGVEFIFKRQKPSP